MTNLFKGISWGIMLGFLFAVIYIHPEFFLNWSDDLPSDVILEKY